jgi:hypothetical protein
MTQIPAGAYVRIGRRNYPLRPKHKSRRKVLEKALDAAFSLYVRQRDKKCFTPSPSCGGVLQCGHLFKRSDRATRWDERFAFGQCAGHNKLHEHQAQIMTAEFIRRFGAKLYLKGEQLKRTIKKHSLAELESLLGKYR